MNDHSATAPRPVPSEPAQAAPERESRDYWHSEELLGSRTEVLILHNNEVYRLRRTRHGKLILQK